MARRGAIHHAPGATGTTAQALPAREVTALFAAVGCFALAIGAVVYMADRAATPAALMPAFALLGTGPLFGVFGPWLPSFVHPFAFSLLTAAALPPRPAWRHGACAAWCAVNVAFEIGQHPSLAVPLAHAVLDTFGRTTLTQSLANYFLRGTFDPGDLAAAVLGAAAAAGLIDLVRRYLENDHGQ